MSRFRVSLRVMGPLSGLQDLVADVADAGLPVILREKGKTYDRSSFIQPRDVLVIDLARWEFSSYDRSDDLTDSPSISTLKMMEACSKLSKIVHLLSQMDARYYDKSLGISTIRQEDQGGLELPAKLISIAAEGGLSIGISILVLFDEDS